MTIQQFENEVPQKELKIGREHFSREKVMDLQEISPGKWSAHMMSTKYITISIELKADIITKANCPCPVFKPDSFCKHVIAVLFGIQYNKGLISDADAFVGSDPGANSGKLTTAEDKAAMVGYAKQVRESLNPFRDYGGYIYRDKTRQAMKKPEQLLTQAKAAIDDKDFTKSINIIIAVIEAVSVGVEKMEHGKDTSMEFYDEAFGILETVCDKADTPNVINRLLEHILSLTESMLISTDDYYMHWLKLLINKKLDAGKSKKKILGLLDKLVLKADKDDKREFLELKLSYLEKNQYDQEAKLFLDKHPNLRYTEYELKQLKLEAERNDKIDKMRTEMDAAKAAGNNPKYVQLRYSLYQLMRHSADKDAFRVIATEMLAFSQHPDILAEIKRSYSPDEWKEKAEQYETLMKKKPAAKGK